MANPTTGSLYDFQIGVNQSGSGMEVPTGIALDTNHFVVVYANNPNIKAGIMGGLLSAKIGTINGTTIIYGAESSSIFSASIFDGDYTPGVHYRNIEIAAADSSSYCVIFDELFNNGTNIAKSMTLFTVDTANNYQISWSLNSKRPGRALSNDLEGIYLGHRCGVDQINTRLVAMVGQFGSFMDGGFNQHFDQYVYLFSITGSTINYEGRSATSALPSFGMRVKKLTTNKFIVVAGDAAILSGSIWTLNNATLTEGSVKSIYNGIDGVLPNDGVNVRTLIQSPDSGTFIFTYSPNQGANHPLYINYCTVSASVITTSSMSGSLIFSGSEYAGLQTVNDLVGLSNFLGTNHSYQVLSVDTRTSKTTDIASFWCRKITFNTTSNQFSLFGTASILNTSGSSGVMENAFFNTKLIPMTADEIVFVGRSNVVAVNKTSPAMVLINNLPDPVYANSFIVGARQIIGINKIQFVG